MDTTEFITERSPLNQKKHVESESAYTISGFGPIKQNDNLL